MIVRIEEARDDILRRARGLSAAKWHEHHFVAVKRSSIPASVLAYEGTTPVARGKIGARVHRQSQGCHVGAQGVIRRDRCRHEVGPLRHNPGVQVLAEVAIGPAVKAAVLHRGQIIRDQVGPDLIAFVGDRPELAGLRLPLQAGRIAYSAGEDAMCARCPVDLPNVLPDRDSG